MSHSSAHDSSSPSVLANIPFSLLELAPMRLSASVGDTLRSSLQYAKVADQLGLSLSGAKSRIQRGRTMLQEMLDQCCTFERDRQGTIAHVSAGRKERRHG